jgi:acetyl esterase/lipase
MLDAGIHQNKSGENMRQATLCTAGAIAFTLLMAPCAYSQTLNIWPGVAPGSENWTQQERTVDNNPIGTVVFNVVTPTLTVYLPERTKATGTGVIIAPGGAFVALAIDLEGYNVARWLQNKGIAAFVLKYRIMEKRQEGIPSDSRLEDSSRITANLETTRHGRCVTIRELSRRGSN